MFVFKKPFFFSPELFSSTNFPGRDEGAAGCPHDPPQSDTPAVPPQQIWGSGVGPSPALPARQPQPYPPLSCTTTKLNNCNSLFIYHLTVTYCKSSRF